MRVPTRRFSLASGLVCEPRDKRPNVVQEHVVKHPVGVTSLVAGGAWSDERWDELGVIDASVRASFIAHVLQLRDGHRECAVPEIRGSGARSSLDALACRSCPTALAAACEAASSSTIAPRYLAVLDELLAAVSSADAESMSKETLTRHLFAALRSTPALSDVVVGYGGLDARNRRAIILRLSRGDGVRAELFFEEPDQLSWRTLHRSPRAVETPNARLQFLMDAPPQGKSTTPLSEICLVSRPFYRTA